ncbi:MAG: hypothetical protein ACKVX9_09565 [Blastocatellia bacterium]
MVYRILDQLQGFWMEFREAFFMYVARRRPETMKSKVAQAVQLVPRVRVPMEESSARAPEAGSFEAQSFSESVCWMRHKLDSLCHFFNEKAGEEKLESGGGERPLSPPPLYLC